MARRNTALVLASSAGLGLAVAESLYKKGNNLIMMSQSDKIYEAKKKLETLNGPGDILALQGDVTNLQDLDVALKKGLEMFGAIDILFTNVGGPRPGDYEEVTLEDYHTAHEQLLVPIIYLTKKLVPMMKERAWGRIIINTSLTAKEPASNLILSNIYRAALVSYGKTLATQLASQGITVNTVAPAAFKTERAIGIIADLAKRNGITAEEVEAKNVSGLPMKRYNEPFEFGEVVAFLASKEGAGITGSYIAVDGGISHGIF